MKILQYTILIVVTIYFVIKASKIPDLASQLTYGAAALFFGGILYWLYKRDKK